MSLTKQQALDLFRSDDLIGLGMAANALRQKLHQQRQRKIQELMHYNLSRWNQELTGAFNAKVHLVPLGQACLTSCEDEQQWGSFGCGNEKKTLVREGKSGDLIPN